MIIPDWCFHWEPCHQSTLIIYISKAFDCLIFFCFLFHVSFLWDVKHTTTCSIEIFPFDGGSALILMFAQEKRLTTFIFQHLTDILKYFLLVAFMLKVCARNIFDNIWSFTSMEIFSLDVDWTGLLFSYIKSCARKTEHIKFSWEVDGGDLVKLKPRIKLFYKGEIEENILQNI